MARENKTKGKAAAESSKDGDKPLPTPRPGTSGTENVLMTNRRQASDNYKKAQRAENAYRARKRAALARHNYTEVKAHFKEGFGHLKLGMKGLFSVLKGIPYILGDKREKRRLEADSRKRQRVLEQKKKLEEALARDSSMEPDEAKPEAAA